ncbi:MAG: RNA polymerase sigma-70 factor [Agriterribacter sp.]
MEQITTGTTTIVTTLTASSFEAIFTSFYGGLHGYACTLIRNEAAAEGIVQQVFLKLWEKRSSLSIDISVKAYLYKSVYNHCLNYIKHRQIQSVHEKYIAKQPVSLAEASESKVLGKELREHIKAAIEDLPEQCGIIFKMSRFEDLKYQEIASKLGISIKTVEAQMGKALRLMRLRLAEYLPITIVLWVLTA